jgi:hypothetical protein
VTQSAPRVVSVGAPAVVSVGVVAAPPVSTGGSHP